MYDSLLLVHDRFHSRDRDFMFTTDGRISNARAYVLGPSAQQRLLDVVPHHFTIELLLGV